jgi:hypothetical protein
MAILHSFAVTGPISRLQAHIRHHDRIGRDYVFFTKDQATFLHRMGIDRIIRSCFPLARSGRTCGCIERLERFKVARVVYRMFSKDDQPSGHGMRVMLNVTDPDERKAPHDQAKG